MLTSQLHRHLIDPAPSQQALGFRNWLPELNPIVSDQTASLCSLFVTRQDLPCCIIRFPAESDQPVGDMKCLIAGNQRDTENPPHRPQAIRTVCGALRTREPGSSRPVLRLAARLANVASDSPRRSGDPSLGPRACAALGGDFHAITAVRLCSV